MCMFKTRLMAFVALCCAAFASPLAAQERGLLDYTTFATNDLYGDGQDRWQSASNTISFLYGPKDRYDPPAQFGRLWELRGGLQIITPENTRAPAAGDRRVAGILRAGLWTHAARGGWDVALGGGVEAVGPATRLISLQDRFHQRFGFDRISAGAQASQIGNRVRPMASATASYDVSLGDAVTLRPFVEGRYGLESFARAGFDLTLGPGFDHGVFGRDYVTGHKYQVLEGATEPGVTAVFGADVARVFSSAYLPAPTYGPTALRSRVRAGMMVEDKLFSLFYGATYLGPEFVGQGSGQVVGSWQLQLKF